MRNPLRHMLNLWLPRPTLDLDGLHLSILAHRLGLGQLALSHLMAGGPLPPRLRYRHLTIQKRDGSPRRVVEPGPDLKAAQRKLLHLYLDRIEPHPAALGFRHGRSTADHAWAHAGAALIITADIADFFPSTRRERVKVWWQTQGFSDPEVRLLTALTTYQGALPQGAPTSPALSNLVNYELDAALERRVRQNGGTYTRYGDDLAFSWPDGYAPPAGFENAVRALLHQAGYRLHPRKGWRVWQRSDEPEITGLVLTRRGDVQLPAAMRQRMRDLSRRHGTEEQASLAGYQGYAAMIRRPGSKQ